MQTDTRPLTTRALATQLGIEPHTMIVRVCRTGSYFGVKPTKLKNRRLIWPEDSFERLSGAGTKNGFAR